jgi:heme exporter protein CcmD
MNPKHALFIWTSYALTFAVLAWNALAPLLRRRALRQILADAAEPDEATE